MLFPATGLHCGVAPWEAPVEKCPCQGHGGPPPSPPVPASPSLTFHPFALASKCPPFLYVALICFFLEGHNPPLTLEPCEVWPLWLPG